MKKYNIPPGYGKARQTNDNPEDRRSARRLSGIVDAFDNVVHLASYPTSSSTEAEPWCDRFRTVWNVVDPKAVSPGMSNFAYSDTTSLTGTPGSLSPGSSLTPQSVRAKKQVSRHFGSINQQLAALGRELIQVPRDGDCMFASVAQQVKSRQLDQFRLRRLVCEEARRSPEKYEDFLANGNREKFLKQVARLENDGAWNLSIGDIALAITYAVLGERIVVIRNHQKRIMFPEDGRQIGDDAIVIVQNDSRTHYSATRLLYWDEEVRAIGLTAEQLSFIGREIDPVPAQADTMFEAIARQLQQRHITAESLRDFTIRKGNSDRHTLHRHIYEYLGKNSYKAGLEDLKEMGSHLTKTAEAMALDILAAQLDLKLVIMTDNQRPVHFPDDEFDIDENTVVIVKDPYATFHYDATKPKAHTWGSFGYGTIEHQLAKLGREMIVETDSSMSMFSSIARQLSPSITTADLLQKVLQEESVLVSKYYHYYPEGNGPWQMERDFKRFCEEGVWVNDLCEPLLHMIRNVTGRKIVVLCDQSRPKHIPEFDDTINSKTVVIARVLSESHGSGFNSTKPKRVLRPRKTSVENTKSSILSHGQLDPTQNYDWRQSLNCYRIKSEKNKRQQQAINRQQAEDMEQEEWMKEYLQLKAEKERRDAAYRNRKPLSDIMEADSLALYSYDDCMTL